jgi:PAS domain S-box-containing protein
MAPTGSEVDALLESLPTVAVQGFGPDLRIDFWNTSSTALYGWRRDEALGQRLDELLLLPGDQPAYLAAVAALMDGSQPAPPPVLLEVRHRDGHTVPALCCLAMRQRGAAGPQVFCIDIDLRPQQQALAALRASEERLRVLADLSADWFWETDAEHRYSALHGEPGGQPDAAAAYLGKCRWEIDDGGLTEPQWDEHRALLARREPFRNFALRRFDAAGRARFYIVSGQPRFDGAGRFTGYVGVGRDLTELYEARRESERLQAQLREAQKLEALGTLAGGVAHDFNNLLGALLGSLKMAREDAANGFPVTSHLVQMERTGQRARELVQRILAYSRRTPAAMAPAQVQPMLNEAIALLRSTLPARVALATDLVDEPLWAELDTGQWQTALVNLGVNAWQALEGGSGSVCFGTRADTFSDGRPAIALWVRDTGCGMDEETRRRAFEPFFTTKAPGEGTGLGLALVHSVVVSHGGEIEIQTTPGAGTTVYIRLPRSAAHDPATADDASESAPQALPRGHRLLLVDDDDVVRLVASALLERAGCVVTAVGSGDTALERLAAEPRSWQLLLTDLHMPGLDGLDLAQRVSMIAPGLPTVLLSGNLSDAARARALACGVRALVHKERIAEELLPTVSAVLGGPRGESTGR